MKYLFSIILVLIVLINTKSAVADTRLWVLDPRGSNWQQPASIDEMTLYFKPQGTYIATSMYLTISPKGSSFKNNTDTVESTLRFELPQNAFINDLWLWMDNGIPVQAKLMDKWTAGFIYENIVKRRRDPAFLTKESASQYQLQIFPMVGDGSRKVLIKFMIPCDWGIDYTQFTIPQSIYQIIQQSNVPLANIKMYVRENLDFYAPQFVDFNEFEFKNHNGSEFSDALLTEFNPNVSNPSKIKFSHKFKDEVFFSTMSKAGEKFYQLIFPTQNKIKIENPKKIAFALDYHHGKSYVAKKTMFDNLRIALKANLHSKDSFNIFASNLKIRRASSTWIAATHENIEEALKVINENELSNMTYLPSLILETVNWTCQNSDTAQILVIANSDSHGDQQTANELGAEVLKVIKPNVSISIATYLDNNWVTNYIGIKAYSGNDYFYQTITGLTRGMHNKILSNNISLLLNSTINLMLGNLKGFNSYTRLQDGFGYDKVYPFETPIDLSKNITELGKFTGSLPFDLEFSGVYRDKVFFTKYSITKETTAEVYDSRTIWAGNTVRAKENKPKSEVPYYEIIKNSLDYRVLSLYTAFLALEIEDPNNHTIENPEEEDNDTWVYEDYKQNANEYVALSIYPNPVLEDATINIAVLNSNLKIEQCKLQLIDMIGNTVLNFELNQFVGTNEISIPWASFDFNGNKLSKGMYLLILDTPFGKITLKVNIQ